jgi:hypothetical protein
MRDDAQYKLNQTKKAHQKIVKDMKQGFEQVEVECKGLHSNLDSMLEQLCKSEAFISKAIKTIKQQDELTESNALFYEKFYAESESMLRAYYNEKLLLCFEQIRLREKPLSKTVSVQTDPAYGLITDEILIDKKQLKQTQIVKEKYETLYTESVDNLEDALKECSRLETKTRSIKK